MSVAVWDDSYKTGDVNVDEQHRELFRMVNELHDAIVTNKGREHMGPTLEKLARYTVEHFQTEEALMTRVNYPAMAGHQKKHADLTMRVTELLEKFKSGKMTLSTTLSIFLSDWLRHHIKEDDVALVKFVKSQSQAAKAAAKS
jgi:hemerythrin